MIRNLSWLGVVSLSMDLSMDLWIMYDMCGIEKVG
jgi:hypothetical protein